MKTLTTLLIAALIVVAGGICFAYSGVYDVSASSPHSGFVRWLLSTTSEASIERHAGNIEAPDLSDESMVRAGASDFDAMCVGCHGAPGRQPDPVGQGLNPPPPDLAESASHMNPAELFWVIKHGVRMTGMPAWGATHEDDELWPVVAFIETLPELDAGGYQALLDSAEGMGHHHGDESHEGHHADHGQDDSHHQETDADGHHDHSEHEH